MLAPAISTAYRHAWKRRRAALNGGRDRVHGHEQAERVREARAQRREPRREPVLERRDRARLARSRAHTALIAKKSGIALAPPSAAAHTYVKKRHAVRSTYGVVRERVVVLGRFT